jgi:hypothetical protein
MEGGRKGGREEGRKGWREGDDGQTSCRVREG